jgi:DNA replication protein DnaC
VTGPAAPPLPAELELLLRRVRLPYLRKAAPDVLATAKAQRWDPAEVLLLAEEVTGRDAATRRVRRKAAGFPSGKTFATWRPEESSIPGPTQNALGTLEWVSRAENLVAAGPSGTGKSHFVEALAHAAIEKDLRVAWFTLETLTGSIARAKVDGSVARTVARICRCDLIVVDDIGMLPAGQDAAEAFYRLVDAAYERRSVAVTSNIHPGWAGHHHAQDTGHRHRRPADASRPPSAYLRNAKLQLSAVLAPGDEVPGLYLHPDHRRRLRRAPVRSDLSV